MKKALLLALCLTMTFFSTPSQSACWPWNKCFYEGAFDYFKQMADSAASIGNAAVHGDIDGVANGVINQLTNAGPFRDAMFSMITDIAPGQVGQYVRVANDLRAKVEQEANGMRAQTYRNLYATYKNDASTLATRLKEGNMDFSEYYRYSFYYAVATSDWSSPEAMKASAIRIAEDQYAAYSWYSAHTVKGAAIGTARDRVGLSDEAIKDGVRRLAEEVKSNKELKQMGPIILAQFAAVAASARNEVTGQSRTACARVFTDSSNIEYCVQRCLPGLNSPDGIADCAAGTPPVITACRGKFTDPDNQAVCLTRCKHAKTSGDIDYCSNAAAPVINICRAMFSDAGNQAVCIKRCEALSGRGAAIESCAKEVGPIVDRCRNLYTDQSNINYCKDHCAQAPLSQLQACRMHSAEMINTGRRDPFVPSVSDACAGIFSDLTNVQYCKDHCARAPTALLDQCARHAAEMINTNRRDQPFRL